MKKRNIKDIAEVACANIHLSVENFKNFFIAHTYTQI